MVSSEQRFTDEKQCATVIKEQGYETRTLKVETNDSSLGLVSIPVTYTQCKEIARRFRRGDLAGKVVLRNGVSLGDRLNIYVKGGHVDLTGV